MSDYWKDNGIDKPQEVIVCAAVRAGELMLVGARHYDRVMRLQIDRMYPTSWRMYKQEYGESQGFINQFGEFRTREEALAIVKQNGQPFNEQLNGSKTELFSEGLY